VAGKAGVNIVKLLAVLGEERNMDGGVIAGRAWANIKVSRVKSGMKGSKLSRIKPAKSSAV